jgi:hypothetical protein
MANMLSNQQEDLKMKPTLNDLLDAYEFAAKRFGKGTGFANEVTDLRAMIDADLAAQSAADRAQRQAEPVAWIDSHALAWLRTASGAQAYVMSALHKSAQDGDEPIYTAAPSPVQAPLIPCRLQELWNDAMQANPQSTTDAAMAFARAVEVEHGINCPW